MFHEVQIGCVLTAAFCCKPSLTIVAFLAGKLLYEVSAFSSSCPLLQIVTPPVLSLQDFAGPLKWSGWKEQNKTQPDRTSKNFYFYVILMSFAGVRFLHHCGMLTCFLLALNTCLAKNKVSLLIFAGSSPLSLLPGKDHINSKLTRLHVQLWCFIADEISWYFTRILQQSSTETARTNRKKCVWSQLK